MDPGEDAFKPMVFGDRWVVEDLEMQWPGPMARQWRDVVFPGADLEDINARLKHMDDFGVDVQVLFPTWWLLYPVASPAAEAAMYRSYNRWVAAGTADSGGRLRWAALAPVRRMERAFEELDFAKEHGAASVFLLGQTHGLSLADPTMFPLYAKAQDLDLTISVHVGGDLRDSSRRQPGNALYANVMTSPGAFFALLWGRVMDQFPRLRWSFLEAARAGALRPAPGPSAPTAPVRPELPRLAREPRWIIGAAVTIACQIDDDIPYTSSTLSVPMPSSRHDYGHLDLGSDPDGMH